MSAIFNLTESRANRREQKLIKCDWPLLGKPSATVRFYWAELSSACLLRILRTASSSFFLESFREYVTASGRKSGQ